MSTNATLLVVGGGVGADESVEVCAGTEVPSTADVVGVGVVGVGVVFVVTVVRGGTEVVVPRADVDVDVDVDRIVGGLVTTVSTGVPDDADVGADESSPSLHPPTVTIIRATSTTLDRDIIRSIMSPLADKVSAMRDNGARLAIVNITIHTDCDSTSMGQDFNEKT